MPRRPQLRRRLATTAAWPFGIALTSWRYLWRTTPLHRRELRGSSATDAPPPLLPGVEEHGLQPAERGVGPLFHRRYKARISGSTTSAEELITRISTNLNQVTPNEMARFTKVRGDETSLRTGDEYVVRMPGPWDGPVRVVDVTATSFRLATLEGHLEAGQIEFRADLGRELVFTIESWARSGDPLSRLLYHRLHMAKEVQLHLWTSFLERVTRLAGGRLVGGIDIDTRWFVDASGGPSRPLGDPQARRTLDQLHDKGLNFELDERHDFTPERGWRVDDYCQPLPPEPPGPPLAGGSWEVARRLLRDYEFADPSIVRAVYHPDQPLEERDMLLEVRVWGLRFRFGVRVGGVLDETRRIDGREVRVWGWNYRTLQGHLEMGQMDYEVWKWLDTGAVEFRACRFSRHAHTGNPVVRLGLRLFGRYHQVRFAHRACARMARLTAAALQQTDEAASIPRAADQVEVRTAADG
ncbi:MAG: DUF1990 family protein [Acidimicrobiales bacterium]